MADNEMLIDSTTGGDADAGAVSKSPTKPRTTTKASKGADNSSNGEKQEKKAPAKKQAYMYLGPNIPGGILFTGSVYKELPEHLTGVFEKLPEIKELFIEIKNVPAFKAELERQGSEPFRMRQSVVRLISEGALKDGGV